MPVPLTFDFIKKLLAFIDMECCRLAKIVRKKDKKRRKFYSTTVTTEHSKRVNEHVMELAYNIKKEIQLEELNVTYLLYKKMIEFIQDMQQEIRNTISKVQIENNACFMELQKRKEKVVEIENKHVEIFSFPKEPEIPLRRLQEEQVEPVICLQENKFGSVPWLKQELARSAQRLQQEQEESTQRFQQEVERILQTLHQGFIEITRDVKQKNAEVSPRFPQRIARNAREEMQAEMVKLRFRSAEITRLLQEQTESSPHIKYRQKGPKIYFQQGQELPAMCLQQDQRTSIRLPQKKSVSARLFHQVGGKLIFQTKQVGPKFCLQQEQARPTIRLQQDEARSAMHLQPDAGPATRLQPEEADQSMCLQLMEGELEMHLQQLQARLIMRVLQEQSGQEVRFQHEQAGFPRSFEQAVTRSNQLLQQEQAEVAIALQQNLVEMEICLEQQAGEAMRLRNEQELAKWVDVGLSQTTQRLQQEQAVSEIRLQLEQVGSAMRLQQEHEELASIDQHILWLPQEQAASAISLQKEQVGTDIHVQQTQALWDQCLQQEHVENVRRLE